MESLVSEKRSDTRGRMLSVVIGEFRKREQMLPVILLVVDEDPEVLLEDLVHPFCLTVGFRVVSCGKVSVAAAKASSRLGALV